MSSTGTLYCYVADVRKLEASVLEELGIDSDYALYVGMTMRDLDLRDNEHRHGGTCKVMDRLCEMLPRDKVTLVELVSGIASSKKCHALETMLIEACRERYGSAVVNVVTRTTGRQAMVDHTLVETFVRCEARIEAFMDELGVESKFEDVMSPFRRVDDDLTPNESRSLKVQLYNANKRYDEMWDRHHKLLERDNVAEAEKWKKAFRENDELFQHAVASREVRRRQLEEFLLEVAHCTGIDDERLPQDLRDGLRHNGLPMPRYETYGFLGGRMRMHNMCRAVIVDADNNRKIMIEWDYRTHIVADSRERSIAGYELLCALVLWISLNLGMREHFNGDFLVHVVERFVEWCNEFVRYSCGMSDLLGKASFEIIPVRAGASEPGRVMYCDDVVGEMPLACVLLKDGAVVNAVGFPLSDLLMYPVANDVDMGSFDDWSIFENARVLWYYFGRRLMGETARWGSCESGDHRRWEDACTAYRAYHEDPANACELNMLQAQKSLLKWLDGRRALAA